MSTCTHTHSNTYKAHKKTRNGHDGLLTIANKALHVLQSPLITLYASGHSREQKSKPPTPPKLPQILLLLVLPFFSHAAILMADDFGNCARDAFVPCNIQLEIE